jgi:thiol-disulfide isomerase/thioredoxin/uncharacterized membrane protein YphA (DoxX/SURF4 family)
MDVLLLAARLGLAAVFVVAGAGKLADLPGSRKAVAAFGVPEGLAATVGVLLPLAELAVALMLLPRTSAWFGAIGALVLLVSFIVGIGVNLAHGNTPDCHCFGQIYSKPVGRETLLRNGALALVAGFVVAMGRPLHAGPSAFVWLSGLSHAEIVGVVFGGLIVGLLLIQTWFLVRLSLQHDRLLRARSSISALAPEGGAAHIHDEAAPPAGMPVGSPAPRFTLPDLHGSMVTLDDLLAEEKPVMLFFTNPGCIPCAALMPEIGRWQREHPARLTVAVIGEGTAEENRSKVEGAGLRDVLLQRQREIAEAYEVHATPGAVVVYPEGVVGSPVALGAESICGLLEQVLEIVTSHPIPLREGLPERAPAEMSSENGRHTVSLGDLSPNVTVTSLLGSSVPLPDLLEGETLLIFWSSSCGFCAQMQPRLLSWEQSPSPGAPKLLILLSASRDGKQVVSFRSPVVIDLDGAAARAFGANGTPMGVLIDAQGRVASNVAGGEAEVMQLAGEILEDDTSPRQAGGR